VGRGTLLGVLRPKYGVEYERGVADVFGIVLRAVIVDRPTLLSGGRGTERDMGEAESEPPPDLALPLFEGSDNDLSPLRGGWGTERPAAAGDDCAAVCRPSGA
jgi:hypothetical protein